MFCFFNILYTVFFFLFERAILLFYWSVLDFRLNVSAVILQSSFNVVEGLKFLKDKKYFFIH